MADSSNKFSLQGFNRQKNFSGLHARRPENQQTYYNLSTIYAAPQYVSILGVNTISNGTEYPKESSVVFPNPEHPQGIRASGVPVFQCGTSWVNINQGGTGYHVGDELEIHLDNKQVGIAVVSQTGINGSITNFTNITNLKDLNSNSGIPYIIDNINGSANFSYNNLFDITGIEMTNVGQGYQTYDSQYGLEIEHDPTVYPVQTTVKDDSIFWNYYNTVNEVITPFVGSADTSAQIFTQYVKSHRVCHENKPNKFKEDEQLTVEEFNKNFIIQHTILLNKSLGAP
jgi:hypothetical protein